MVLQEAFMERNDLRKKIQRVNSELKTVLITEAGEIPQFNASDKLSEVNTLQKQLFELNIKIDKANSVNIERLHKLRFLDEQIKDYSHLRDVLLSWSKRKTIGYSDTTVEMQRNLEFDEISKRLFELEKERRSLDREIQKINWQTEI
jgi:hypothetical protein